MNEAQQKRIDAIKRLVRAVLAGAPPPSETPLEPEGVKNDD